MSDPHPVPLRIGRVALTVRDLDAAARFYREVVGLRDLPAAPGTARLGTGDAVLLELRHDPSARPHSPREAGLFHTAFLLPSRADLGRWLGHVAARRVPLQGASDHAVSEAVYLADPEGNGVEVYADRPRDTWTWSGGSLKMGSDPLDADDLLAAGGSRPWEGAPDGTTVGHVHLQTGSIAPADAFYGGVLGLALTTRYPGASFFGSGGYHHHLAANTWNSRDAGPRTGPATGLAVVDLVVADAATLEGVARRAAAAGTPMTRHGAALTLRDPWGTALTLAKAAS